MGKQYIEFSNKDSLDKYFNTLNNFQTGEIIYLTEEEKFVMFDGENFVNIPEKVQATGEGLSMSLYELNKTIVAQLPVKETNADMSDVRNTIDDFRKSIGASTFMLLCKDISYYTIFQNDEPKMCDFGTLGYAVTECAQAVGKIVCADIVPDGAAVELWVRTPEGDNLCMYLFNCADLIVTYGR